MGLNPNRVEGFSYYLDWQKGPSAQTPPAGRPCMKNKNEELAHTHNRSPPLLEPIPLLSKPILTPDEVRSSSEMGAGQEPDKNIML